MNRKFLASKAFAELPEAVYDKIKDPLKEHILKFMKKFPDAKDIVVDISPEGEIRLYKSMNEFFSRRTQELSCGRDKITHRATQAMIAEAAKFMDRANVFPASGEAIPKDQWASGAKIQHLIQEVHNERLETEADVGRWLRQQAIKNSGISADEFPTGGFGGRLPTHMRQYITHRRGTANYNIPRIIPGFRSGRSENDQRKDLARAEAWLSELQYWGEGESAAPAPKPRTKAAIKVPVITDEEQAINEAAEAVDLNKLVVRKRKPKAN